MRICHNISNNKGSSTVEFVLIFLIWIVVMIGIVDFSRAWWLLNSLNLAAREGARYAVILPNLNIDDTRVSDYVHTTLQSVLNPATVNVSVHFDNSPVPLAGDTVTTITSYTYSSLLAPFIPGLPSMLNLRGRMVMRYEVY